MLCQYKVVVLADGVGVAGSTKPCRQDLFQFNTSQKDCQTREDKELGLLTDVRAGPWLTTPITPRATKQQEEDRLGVRQNRPLIFCRCQFTLPSHPKSEMNTVPRKKRLNFFFLVPWLCRYLCEARNRDKEKNYTGSLRLILAGARRGMPLFGALCCCPAGALAGKPLCYVPCRWHRALGGELWRGRLTETAATISRNSFAASACIFQGRWWMDGHCR